MAPEALVGHMDASRIDGVMRRALKLCGRCAAALEVLITLEIPGGTTLGRADIEAYRTRSGWS